MTPDEWLAQARLDAERRGLDTLKPLLDALARSTATLRRAADERLPAAGRPARRDQD